MSALVLGTAQFGFDYGINNKNGKIAQNEINKILNYAYDDDISILDTASAYGDSESVLGKAIHELNKSFSVITKYPAKQSGSPLLWIDKSLQQLNLSRVYGYLFHSYETFQAHPEYIEDFIKIKEKGKAQKTGFSLYYPSEAEYIINNDIPCDIVQIPYNIFDQRFIPILPVLKSKNIEIYARSVFLQGLFFIPIEDLDIHFSQVKENLKYLHKFVHDNNLNISSACLGYVNANKYIDKIVIGIDSLNNLMTNIDNFKIVKKINVDYSPLKKLSIDDEQIILPFNWKQKNSV